MNDEMLLKKRYSVYLEQIENYYRNTIDHS